MGAVWWRPALRQLLLTCFTEWLSGLFLNSSLASLGFSSYSIPHSLRQVALLLNFSIASLRLSSSSIPHSLHRVALLNW